MLEIFYLFVRVEYFDVEGFEDIADVFVFFGTAEDFRQVFVDVLVGEVSLFLREMFELADLFIEALLVV